MRVFYKSGLMSQRQQYIAFKRDLTDIVVHIVDERLQCITNKPDVPDLLVTKCGWEVLERHPNGVCLLEHAPEDRTTLLQSMAAAFKGIDVVDF